MALVLQIILNKYTNTLLISFYQVYLKDFLSSIQILSLYDYNRRECNYSHYENKIERSVSDGEKIGFNFTKTWQLRNWSARA